MTTNQRHGLHKFYIRLIMKKIPLESYDIVIGDASLSLQEVLRDRRYTQIAVLVDEHTSHHCLPKVKDIIPAATVIEISSGEQNKIMSVCESIWSQMASARMDRQSLLINLGGGVIGDMGGFAASCFMRGIDFIQVPTTLLAQVDASVGGKLAIDFQNYKNYIGLFCNPIAVLVDPQFLKTLPPRELRSGYAEMIKHGLIKSSTIWDRLSGMESIYDITWDDEITASIGVKRDVITEDPKELGMRKVLNFGHTIGHALESYALHTTAPLLHGEAIALGMIAESFLSKELLSLSEISLNNIVAHIKEVYHDLSLVSLDHSNEVFDYMGADKKNRGGEIRTALLQDIGQATFDIPLSKHDVERALAFTKVVMS